MDEKARNYTISSIPAAWQQQQEYRRSGGPPSLAKFGEGAAGSASQ